MLASHEFTRGDRLCELVLVRGLVRREPFVHSSWSGGSDGLSVTVNFRFQNFGTTVKGREIVRRLFFQEIVRRHAGATTCRRAWGLLLARVTARTTRAHYEHGTAAADGTRPVALAARVLRLSRVLHG